MSVLPVLNIKSTEYIGNSLATINSNFTSLDTTVQSISSRQGVIFTELDLIQYGVSELLRTLNTNYTSRIAELRLSCSEQYNDVSQNTKRYKVKNVHELYLHPINGGNVSLYDSLNNLWKNYVIPGVLPFSIHKLKPNTIYDVYLSHDNALYVFNLHFVEWKSSTIPSTKAILDGVPILDEGMILGQPTGEYTQVTDAVVKRFIGCIYNTQTGIEQTYGGTQAAGTNSKQLLWNANNQLECFIKDTNLQSKYTLNTHLPLHSKNINIFNKTNGNKTFWNRTNNSTDNQFLFVCGEKTRVHITYSNTCTCSGMENVYAGISIDNEFAPERSTNVIINQNVNGLTYLQCTLESIVEPGIHYIYTFDAAGKNVVFNTQADCNFTVKFLN